MRTMIASILPFVWLCGCADDSAPNTPYTLGQALVIGQQEAALTSVDESCDSAACQAVRERCGEDAYADVVVDESGQVLDVICFRGNAEIQEIGSNAVDSASAGNNTVLVLDDVDDGADVTGSVVLTGNNAVLYGRGADVSQVGALDIQKNNAIVRGVSILGDVTIDKNNAQLSFCEIHGDLTILGNNTTLAECVVHGQVQIEGVNTVLVNNRFSTERALAGKNLSCNGNVGIDAAADAEAGATDAPDAGQGATSDITCDNLR
jgi:hypothetical protein